MGKIVYLDCPTGIAGDMCLGALVDAGVPIVVLRQGLDRLGIADQYRLRVERVLKNDQAATKVHVDLRDRESDAFLTEGEGGQLLPPLEHEQNHEPDHDHKHEPEHDHHHDQAHRHDEHHHDHVRDHKHAHGHDDAHHAHGHHHHKHDHSDKHHHHTHDRTLPDIEAMITAAELPDRVQRWSLAVFRRLAQAESEVHNVAPEAVHFHEVGGLDAIVDIVGTCIGLDWLDVETVYCSALPTGGGTVWAAHGRLPVPVPAVLKLWQMRRVPVYDNGIDRELVTPTGAALMVELAAGFGKPPAMMLDRVGWGAGTIDLSLPNALRLWVGDAVIDPATDPAVSIANPELDAQSLGTSETVAVLETQIDDLSPQAIGYVFDRLFEAGALDVLTTPIGMKKSRAGLALTVICAPDLRIACETIIFRETTTLGIRHRLQSRTILAREFETIALDGQTISVKIARDRDGAIVNIQPEYEDVARAARATGRSWLAVQRSVLRQYGNA